MSTAKFIRTIEDFTCNHCGAQVVGDGYTNHCPKCLWSQHVDVNPGDRAATCGGMMEPIAGEKDGKADMIIQKCQICGHIRRASLRSEDSVDAYIAVMKKAALERGR